MQNEVRLARGDRQKLREPGAAGVIGSCNHFVARLNADKSSERQMHQYRVRVEIVERNPALQQAGFPAVLGFIDHQAGTPAPGEPRVYGRSVARYKGYGHVVAAEDFRG